MLGTTGTCTLPTIPYYKLYDAHIYQALIIVTMWNVPVFVGCLLVTVGDTPLSRCLLMILDVFTTEEGFNDINYII